MPVEHIDTLIIGGGQAGLTMSHALSKRGRPHLVLERHRIAERWRSERWDGLRFQFPNWDVELPDFPFRHPDPDAFATPSEIADFIAAYAEFIAAPVRCGVAVTALTTGPRGFIAETSDGIVEAANVVIATGSQQRPDIPAFLGDVPGIQQLHASQYRAPDQLPAGGVLIIGSGASGSQIAEELIRSSRQVFLSVSKHLRLPRRYRGHDIVRWWTIMRTYQTPVEQRGPDRSPVLISGAYGGHTIDFRRLAQDGVVLLGQARAASEGVMRFDQDLAANLAHGDAGYFRYLDMIDAYVEQHGLRAPKDPAARLTLADPPGLIEPPVSLDLRAVGVGTVIWATGYRFDLDWLRLPVLDDRGAPRHRHGVTDVPGLYFLGLQWLSKMTSAFLRGVGDDAARLAAHITARG